MLSAACQGGRCVRCSAASLFRGYQFANAAAWPVQLAAPHCLLSDGQPPFSVASLLANSRSGCLLTSSLSDLSPCPFPEKLPGNSAVAQSRKDEPFAEKWRCVLFFLRSSGDVC